MKWAIGQVGKWVGRYKFHILIFIFSFLILTKFNIDPDLGWHLATGREFLQEGRIIWGDQFSWTMPGYIWGNSYFAYQILVTYLFGNFGHVVTGAIFGILAGTAVLILVIDRKIDFWQFLTVALATAVASASLGIRPHTISFFCFSLLLVFVERKFFNKPKHVFLWFAFFAIWANFHRGFLVGILVLGVYQAIDVVWQKVRLQKDLAIRLSCIVGSILGTFVTPFGWQVWKSAVFDDLTSRDNLLTIAEWQSSAIYFPINLLFALSGAIFIYVFFKQTKKQEPHWFLIAAAIFMFSFVATSFIFFWWAIFIFLISRMLNLRVLKSANFSVKLPIFFSTASFLMIFFLSFLVNFLQSYNLKSRLLLDGYPVEALSFVKDKGLSEKIFNEYGWGGFIDWQAPETLVFIDGRMASWKMAGGRGILADYLAIMRGECEHFYQYDIRVVLVKKNQETSCFFDFQLAYEDSVAKVLIREDVDRLR